MTDQKEESKEQAQPAYVHPHDMKPTIELTVPLSLDLFVHPPVDVLNTNLHDIIGNKFLAKKGLTERERETCP